MVAVCYFMLRLLVCATYVARYYDCPAGLSSARETYVKCIIVVCVRVIVGFCLVLLDIRSYATLVWESWHNGCNISFLMRPSRKDETGGWFFPQCFGTVGWLAGRVSMCRALVGRWKSLIFPEFQGLESPCKETRFLKVVGSLSKSPWI